MCENSSCPQAAKLSQVESSCLLMWFHDLLSPFEHFFQPLPFFFNLAHGVATEWPQWPRCIKNDMVGSWRRGKLWVSMTWGYTAIQILYCYTISILCHTTEVSIIANQELEELRSELVNWQLYFTLWHCIQHDPWWLFYVSVWELRPFPFFNQPSSTSPAFRPSGWQQWWELHLCTCCNWTPAKCLHM